MISRRKQSSQIETRTVFRFRAARLRLVILSEGSRPFTRDTLPKGVQCSAAILSMKALDVLRDPRVRSG
jgi:hypothetical protein